MSGPAATNRVRDGVSDGFEGVSRVAAAGIVRLDKGEGRARRPILAARKVHFEIDLLGMQ